MIETVPFRNFPLPLSLLHACDRAAVGKTVYTCTHDISTRMYSTALSTVVYTDSSFSESFPFLAFSAGSASCNVPSGRLQQMGHEKCSNIHNLGPQCCTNNNAMQFNSIQFNSTALPCLALPYLTLSCSSLSLSPTKRNETKRNISPSCSCSGRS